MRDQLSINDRLREYIERMLTVIIENNPQLLEVTTSSGVSIGSMSSMSSISSQPTKLTITTENNNPPSKVLTPTESIKSDTSLTSTNTTATPPTKESADKYCRL